MLPTWECLTIVVQWKSLVDFVLEILSKNKWNVVQSYATNSHKVYPEQEEYKLFIRT